jgi:uncharacterized membrane protein YsdA (DUF1294 family)
MDYLQQILIGLLFVLNLFSFFAMAYDKRKSTRQNAERTPEGLLFFMATVFGGVGVFLGMQVFRHKTKKWYFQIGIPLLVLQNIVTIYFILGLIRSA